VDDLSLLSKEARPLSPRIADPYCQLWLAVITQAVLDITEPIPLSLRKLRPVGHWAVYKIPAAVTELRKAVDSAIRFLKVDGLEIIAALDRLGYRVNNSMFNGLEALAEKKIRRLEALERLWAKVKKKQEEQAFLHHPLHKLFTKMCEEARISIREFFRLFQLDRSTFMKDLKSDSIGYIPAKKLLSAIDSFIALYPAASERGQELKRAIEMKRKTSRGLIHALATKGTAGWAVERILEQTGWTVKALAGELAVSGTALKKIRYGIELGSVAKERLIKGAVGLAARKPELCQYIEELILAISRPRWPSDNAKS